VPFSLGSGEQWLVFKAHRLYVSPNSRLESIKEEEEGEQWHLNPGKAIFLSFNGNEFYYTDTFILLVNDICVAKFVASK